MIVTIQHLRTVPGLSSRPGFCTRGARVWFRDHGLDWSEFVHHGIEAETLRATGDGLALKLAEWAEQSEATRGQ